MPADKGELLTAAVCSAGSKVPLLRDFRTVMITLGPIFTAEEYPSCNGTSVQQQHRRLPVSADHRQWQLSGLLHLLTGLPWEPAMLLAAWWSQAEWQRDGRLICRDERLGKHRKTAHTRGKFVSFLQQRPSKILNAAGFLFPRREPVAARRRRGGNRNFLKRVTSLFEPPLLILA